MIVPTPIAAMPSTSAWCIFTTSAVRPWVALSTTSTSHSGCERSRRSDIASPTMRHSSASPPGSGHGTVVTWRETSKSGSSSHTGLTSPPGALSTRRMR